MGKEFEKEHICIYVKKKSMQEKKKTSPKGINYQRILSPFLYYSKLKSFSKASITNENYFENKQA